ncbi:hypothetical protein V1512DRAFT_275491 [Lipomyces arxii]|uniref:uncharacterized protein n=1 Tax=Lipomyces arxii TaxID=56418 RepID=UPI0034CD1394
MSNNILNRLSYEIHKKILDYAADSRSESMFRTRTNYDPEWTLVCQYWRDIVQEITFKDLKVTVSLSEQHDNYVNRVRHIIADRPVLGSFIKYITLRFDSPSYLFCASENEFLAESIVGFCCLLHEIGLASDSCPTATISREFSEEEIQFEALDELRTFVVRIEQMARGLQPIKHLKKLTIYSQITTEHMLAAEGVITILRLCPDLTDLKWNFPIARSASNTTEHFLYQGLVKSIPLFPKTIKRLELNLRTAPFYLQSSDASDDHRHESPPSRGGLGDRLGRCLRELSQSLVAFSYIGPISPEFFEDTFATTDYSDHLDTEEPGRFKRLRARFAAEAGENKWPHLESLSIEFERFDSLGNAYKSSPFPILTLEDGSIRLVHAKDVSEEESEKLLNDLLLAATEAAVNRMPKINLFHVVDLERTTCSMRFQRRVGDESLIRPKMASKVKVNPPFTLQFHHAFRSNSKILKLWKSHFGPELHVYDTKMSLPL